MAEEVVRRTTRKSLWKELLLRRPVVLLSVALTVVSSATFVWDEIVAPLLPAGSDRRRVLDAVFLLPWYGWIIVYLMILIFLIVEHAYKLIRKAEDNRDESELELAKQKARPNAPSEPSFSPRSYKKQDDNRCGLTITNSGYAAYDVQIPDAPVGDSDYILHFEGVFSQVLHREEAFFSTWLDSTNGRPGCEGGGLFEIMRQNNVTEIRFGVISKDAGAIPKWYVDECTITRNVQKRRDGIVLSRTGQRVISKPEAA